MFYVKLMVTTKQKPRLDRKKINKKESKHTTMGNHQFTKKGRGRGIKDRKIQNSQKTVRWHY